MQAIPVILNPASSSGKGARVRSRLEEGLTARGVSYRLLETERPGHAVELAAGFARAGVPRVVVVGGDGTIHETINGLLAGAEGASLPEVAVIPVGTGNDFFRMVGVPARLDRALDLLVTGVPHAFDVGHVRWEGGESHFVNLIGVGLDVEVLRSRDGFRKLTGKLQYLAGAIHALTHFKAFPLEIDLGEEGGTPESFSGPSLMAQVTVGPSVGGGIMVSPGAAPDDGLLDLFLVRPLGFLQVVRYLPRVVRGTHGAEKEIELRRFRRLRIGSPGGVELRFQMDGELVDGLSSWLEIRVVPQAVPILVPVGGS